MSDGFESLDAFAARLRSLPELAREAAPEVGEAVRDEIGRQIAAGTDPDGKAWEPRADGGQPLETAGKALAIATVGPRIIVRLRGHVARHHLGRSRGGVERPILPSKITPTLGRAITKVLARKFAERMGGGNAV